MRVLADETRVAGLIDELAGSIAARMQQAGGDGWALVGVRSRGDELARRLADRLDPARLRGRVGVLDITLYRDDLTEIGPQPVVGTTEIGFALDGLSVVLVDDVLMTGRSIRAGLQSLMDLGRPRRVWLSVLVDRGGRELPICPDDVGLDLGGGGPVVVGPGQTVLVSLRPGDDRDAITVADDARRGGGGAAP